MEGEEGKGGEGRGGDVLSAITILLHRLVCFKRSTVQYLVHHTMDLAYCMYLLSSEPSLKHNYGIEF